MPIKKRVESFHFFFLVDALLLLSKNYDVCLKICLCNYYILNKDQEEGGAR